MTTADKWNGTQMVRILKDLELADVLAKDNYTLFLPTDKALSTFRTLYVWSLFLVSECLVLYPAALSLRIVHICLPLAGFGECDCRGFGHTGDGSGIWRHHQHAHCRRVAQKSFPEWWRVVGYPIQRIKDPPEPLHNPSTGDKCILPPSRVSTISGCLVFFCFRWWLQIVCLWSQWITWLWMESSMF